MKRMVSYIYGYKDGRKGDNAGFGKIDISANVLKINITMKDQREIKSYKVYLFVKEEVTRFIYVGDLENVGNSLIMKSEIDFGETTGNTYNVEDIYGIAICSLGIDFISFWKKEYEIQGYEIWTYIDKSRDNLTEALSNSNDDGKVIYVEDEDSIYMLDKECLMGKCSEYKGDKSKDLVAEGREESRPLKSATCVLGKYFKGIEIPEKKIGTDVIRIIGVSPKDIHNLPKENWNLMKNSFVCYSSIKFGKVYLLERESGELLLGIPGYNSSIESIFATRYGFSEFMESDVDILGESSVGQWKRGYWCKKLQLSC